MGIAALLAGMVVVVVVVALEPETLLTVAVVGIGGSMPLFDDDLGHLYKDRSSLKIDSQILFSRE